MLKYPLYFVIIELLLTNEQKNIYRLKHPLRRKLITLFTHGTMQSLNPCHWAF
jgi:hypothetical protein